MTNKEILQKAIDKSYDNGFDLCEFFQIESMSSLDYDYYLEELIKSKGHYIIIFSHDFAKAFWGEEKYDRYCECNLEYPPKHYYADKETLKNWQYHLQQMVLEGEPLKYLEKFL